MWKKRIRTTSFWVGIVSFIVLLADSVSDVFGYSIAVDGVVKIILGLCSCLIVVGFINKKDVDSVESQPDELLKEMHNVNNYTKSPSVDDASDAQAKSDIVVNKNADSSKKSNDIDINLNE